MCVIQFTKDGEKSSLYFCFESFLQNVLKLGLQLMIIFDVD